ncbi:LuxR C-terminal-related transcriptional regulator [Jiangella mangrovi]|uniref:Putative ATPase/DNA-binding CsgD family transcriptional regulator n=1 Tax=Jiangella mangrovi TaxID=1524084 RepID=A0A7W9GPK9_9ACTN|nr:putative ATPase/DNA-binding CsgD family transcriptional regulator [Jiangella mangrovi]
MERPEISAREAEVLAALGEHLTNAEIAGRFVISVRTVESHVSALLRKFGAGDRRALAALAPSVAESSGGADGGASTAPALPAPLTSLVGRVAERAAVASALAEQRLVTAVGPGGVGKTRLALAVAADVADLFPGGAWYADLVPVPDGEALPAAVAAALGLGEQPGRSVAETVTAWAAGRRALLVLDNCEHVVDGVADLVEPLLAASPGLTVLATSRSRLLLPFEWVVPIGGLGDDAVALFEQRSRAAGAVMPDGADVEGRVAAICAALDGSPLAIELAAARLPSVGLDGLESGLGDRLRLLDGARRGGGRHGSLRSALDWSHDLLDEPGRAVLRRVSVFAAPFSVAAADAVVADGVTGGSVVAELAALADHSLLVPVAGRDGTRYLALETIRQYGAELLTAAGEEGDVRNAHLRWCADEGTALLAADPATPDWRGRVDRLADDLHAALGWVTAGDGELPPTPSAMEVALLVGRLCHRRGLPGEAQRRFEQAAALAPDDASEAAALRLAAGSARSRLAGADALRLHLAAAAAAERSGAPVTAAGQLAHAAELVHRSAGILAEVPSEETAAGWLADARRLGGDDPGVLARIAVVEAFAAAADEPDAVVRTERALELASASGDAVVESAALDQLTGLRLARGEARAALASALERTELLSGPLDPEQGFELSDAYGMATESAIAAGDLRLARQTAETLRDLPAQREVAHVGTARLAVVMVLSGDWAEAVAVGELFRESWERAGRPRIPSLRRVAAALGSVHGARGDTAQQAVWRDVEAGVASAVHRPHDQRAVESVFAALEALHLGHPDDAVAVLHREPEEFRGWFELIWRPWYAAAWAEAATLAGLPDAAERIDRARLFTTDNVVAGALVDRAAALADGDTDGVLAAAENLDAAASRYQWARSLLLAGGAHRTRGLSALAELGAPTSY